MKSLIYAAIAASVLAAPAVSFAQQTNAPVTRAQVRAELAELVHAGYNPNDRNHYPENFEAAQQRVAAQKLAQNGGAAQSPAVSTSEGATIAGRTDAGAAATSPKRPGSVYFGH